MPPRRSSRGTSRRPPAKPAGGLVTLPTSWSSDSGVQIQPNFGIIAQVQDLVDKTWRVKRTRDRGKAEVPSGARVLSVLKVENHENYERYFHHRTQVKAKRRGGLPSFNVATDGVLPDELDKDVNEVYLFHGTNPTSADLVARNDFDMARAGSAVGTMFGPGIYLAENASKSDEYAKEGEGIFIGQCALLLCRAVAGKVYTTPDKGDQSGSVKSGQYDSVCGDRLAAVGTFREMIFFDNAAVYPEYIIIYSRLFNTSAEVVPAPVGPSALPAAAAVTTTVTADTSTSLQRLMKVRVCQDPWSVLMYEFYYADGSVFKTHPEHASDQRTGHMGCELTWHELLLSDGEHLVRITQVLDMDQFDDKEHFGHKRCAVFRTDRRNELKVFTMKASNSRKVDIVAPAGKQIMKVERHGHWANPQQNPEFADISLPSSDHATSVATAAPPPVRLPGTFVLERTGHGGKFPGLYLTMEEALGRSLQDGDQWHEPYRGKRLSLGDDPRHPQAQWRFAHSGRSNYEGRSLETYTIECVGLPGEFLEGGPTPWMRPVHLSRDAGNEDAHWQVHFKEKDVVTIECMTSNPTDKGTDRPMSFLHHGDGGNWYVSLFREGAIKWKLLPVTAGQPQLSNGAA
eukprot:TRINITY_DN8254_c0_g1_i1.p1 TRINITY_DN8254_c0_g1~~TRINITY_DN8254_c0_g1_i1.p1  ORF type:complete len:627 (-),score=86.94 TRINITY_DN8254_c0_g1_i1:35-1915(-)